MTDIEQRSSTKKFDIVSPKRLDSDGTEGWKNYCESNQLVEAWALPDASPYQGYMKTRTAVSIDKHSDEIQPRYSEGERNSEEGIANLVESGLLGPNTAVVLDSGGAHSVAMAVRLAERLGYQPIIMFDNDVVPGGANKSEQELATMLYFADRIQRLKETGKITADSPPVFVMDTHRDDYLLNDKEVDNTYTYEQSDLPNAAQLQEQQIDLVVYVNEGDQDGRVNRHYQSIDRVARDLKPVVESWENGGLQIAYTGVLPWKDNDYDFLSDLDSLPGFNRSQLESKLAYPDMQPEVYGNNEGIAMHQNRERFIVTSDGNAEVVMENGMARDMNEYELEHFRSEIEKQIVIQGSNSALANTYQNIFPASL